MPDKTNNVVEMAKKRFDFQADIEQEKQRKMMPNERVDLTQVVGDDSYISSRRPNLEAGAAQIENLMQSMKQPK